MPLDKPSARIQGYQPKGNGEAPGPPPIAKPSIKPPDKDKSRGFKVAQRIEQEANEMRRITETLFLQGNIGPVEYHSICKKTDLIQEGAAIIQGEYRK